MSKTIVSKNDVGDIIDELNFQNEPIPTVMTFSNETVSISVQFHDTPSPSLFSRSISSSTPWSPPSEFSKSAINDFFNSMSVTPSACLHEYDLIDGLVFTNKGFDIGDYNDDEVCVYRIKNIGEAASFHRNTPEIFPIAWDFLGVRSIVSRLKNLIVRNLYKPNLLKLI